jgi:hypothetical protein
MKATTISTEQFLDGAKAEELFFYEKKFNFSYSSINKLLYCPEIFYKEYVLGDREIKDETYLTEGRLIHCLLLEPDKFEQQFIVMTGKMPSENTKIVVDRVYSHHIELRATESHKGDTLADYQSAVIDVLLDMNLHQSLKTDDQRFAKIYTPDSAIYWDFLNKSQGKTIVDAQMYEKVLATIEKIKADDRISKLLRLKHSSEWWSTAEVFNEIPVEMTLKKYPFGLKGIIDNVVVDPIESKIMINDFKTSSKSLADFPETVKFYRYDIQAAIYNLLIVNKYADLIKQGYKVEFRFVVIDKHQQIYPFLVTEATMKEWLKDLQETLKICDYHYTNKDYTLPFKFKKEDVTL